MAKDVIYWVKACPQCQHMHKMKTVAPELQPIKTDGTWDVVGIDLMGPYFETERGSKYIFTATDLFSKFVFARPIKSKAAGDVSAAIIDLFYSYGPPQRVLSDQGREFINELNDHILKAFGVRHSVTSAYHPACNGQDERTNRTLSSFATGTHKE
ncbi:Gypsy retrotransposon integrase-like protein 1 [Lamellibrachia satsuma]|nr:Gypsy retrotransposon integrase-like protein 1 [Lamellibrachia satsuma]